MEVTIEENGPINRLLTIRVPAPRVVELMDAELDVLVKNAKIPGFRPHKAPRGLIESQFRDHIHQEVTEKLVRETLDPALREQNLNMVGPPNLDAGSLVRNEDFVYRVSLQIFPQVSTLGYQGMELNRVRYLVTQEDVDFMVQRIRTGHAKWEARTQRPAQLGDEIMLDFIGTLHGEAFPGGTETNFPLQLGQKRFIGTFEEQLVGIQTGESRQVRVNFPETYPNAKLAGQEAVFECTAREVRERVLPELDDTLAAKVGVKEGGVEALLTDIRQRLEEEARQEGERQIKQEIYHKLLTQNPLELPRYMLENEIELLKNAARQETVRQGGDVNALNLDLPPYRQQLEHNAHERLSLGLLMGSIAVKEGLTINDEQLDDYLNTLTAQYGEHAISVLATIRANKERMEELRGNVLENQVISWIITNGQVTEQERPYGDLSKESA